MAKVIRRIDKETGEKESLESMLKRFKKQILAEDLHWELSVREFYKTPAEKRKLKQKRLFKKS